MPTEDVAVLHSAYRDIINSLLVDEKANLNRLKIKTAGRVIGRRTCLSGASLSAINCMNESMASILRLQYNHTNPKVTRVNAINRA